MYIIVYDKYTKVAVRPTTYPVLYILSVYLVIMFKLLATGALFLGSEEPPRLRAGDGSSFLAFSVYSGNDCKAAEPDQRVAIRLGLCATVNSTSSSDYSCPNATHCVGSHYATEDCSGMPSYSITFPTTGSCTNIQNPATGVTVSSVYEQVDDPTSMMGKPFSAIYADEDCSGDTVVYNDLSLCQRYRGHNSSSKMICADDVLQICSWSKSDMCDPKGVCMASPQRQQCVAFPFGTISYAKATQVHCSTPPPPKELQELQPPLPRALLSVRTRQGESFDRDRKLATTTTTKKKKTPSSGKDVFYPGLAKSSCYRIPTIIRSSKKTLLAFAENRKKKCSDIGDHDIVLRRSSDGGKSWGKMITVVKGKGAPFSNANPVQVGNRILLHFDTMNNPNDDKHGYNMQTWSSDDGKSWSTPTKIKFTNSENTGNLIGPSVGIVSKNGTIYFSMHHKGLGQLYWSSNNGKSWTVSTKPVRGMNECSIAFLVSPTDGRIAMNCRTPKGNRAQTVWSPNGLPGPTTYINGMSDPNCQGSIINTKGKLWVSHPNSKTERVNMIVQESGNLGKTWSSGIEVNRGRAAYSQLVDIGGSKGFLGLLYETDKGHIAFKVVA